MYRKFLSLKFRLLNINVSAAGSKDQSWT